MESISGVAAPPLPFPRRFSPASLAQDPGAVRNISSVLIHTLEGGLVRVHNMIQGYLCVDVVVVLEVSFMPWQYMHVQMVDAASRKDSILQRCDELSKLSILAGKLSQSSFSFRACEAHPPTLETATISEG